METSLRYAIHMIMAAQLCSVKRKGVEVRWRRDASSDSCCRLLVMGNLE